MGPEDRFQPVGPQPDETSAAKTDPLMSRVTLLFMFSSCELFSWI
jgi:hypothetical protein